MTATITDLPPEILVLVVPSLDYGDIIALMLCSRILNFRLFPSLYEELVLTTLGQYHRPVLIQSPRRLTERQQQIFFAGVVDGTIPDDGLASVKHVIIADMITDAGFHFVVGLLPERLQIIQQILPKMINLRSLDFVLAPGSELHGEIESAVIY
jgi:hypothetical protein